MEEDRKLGPVVQGVAGQTTAEGSKGLCQRAAEPEGRLDHEHRLHYLAAALFSGES
jgi:hypothetical protein